MPPALSAATGHRTVVHRAAGRAGRGRGRARRIVARRRQARRLRRRGHRDAVRRPVGRDPAGAGARRHPPGLPARRHLRRRVPRRDPVLLLQLRRAGGRAAIRSAQRDRRRLRPDPHRAGDRVRLLLGARRVGHPRHGPRRGRDQQQPRDGEHRLRRLHAPLLRAARHGERARRHRPRARADRRAAGRGADVRRPDGHRPRQGPRLRRRADRRADGRGDRDHRGSRALRRPARPPRHRGPARAAGRRSRTSCVRRSTRSVACRSSSGRRG